MLDYSAVVTRVATATSWLTTVGWIWEIHIRKSENYSLKIQKNMVDHCGSNLRNTHKKIRKIRLNNSEKYGWPPWVDRPGWTSPPLRHLGYFLQDPHLHPGGKILKLEVKIEAAAATKLCFLHILVLAIVCIILHKASKLFVQDHNRLGFHKTITS